MTQSSSHSIFQRACAVIPGGVNSPVRACRSVGAEPLFVARGAGGYVYDADGNLIPTLDELATLREVVEAQARENAELRADLRRLRGE